MTAKSNMGTLFVIGGPAGLPEALEAFGDRQTLVQAIQQDGSQVGSGGLPLAEASGRPVILLHPRAEGDVCEEWLGRTRRILAQAPTALVVLLSSIEVYGPDHQSVGLMAEDAQRRPAISNTRAEFWEEVEAGVREAVAPGRLLILRCAHVIGDWAEGWVNRLLQRDRVVTVIGYDPSVQLIHESDLVRAVHAAIERSLTGTYNLAPRDALPLGKVLEAAKVRRLPLPWTLLWLFRHRDSGKGSGSAPFARLAYLRYSCTGRGDRFAQETGIAVSTVRALKQFVGEERESLLDLADYTDPHGLDVPFIHRAAHHGLKFFEKIYWRIERKGFEHIPESGPAILVGPHRGFMPLDAVMMVEMLTKHTKRAPRFILHPTLVKFGVLSRFMRRMGGVVACKRNADEILARGELLGIYPEGIRGAFKYYKEAYEFGRFGRSNYAHFALEHGVPVIPFVIVGCAEIFPILGKIQWRWFKKHIEWPCLPITPTFPFLPLPLPSKWHLQILPPIDPDRAIEEAERTGRKPHEVIVEQVKMSIEEATTEMLEKRKSIFFGKVFAE